MRFIFLTSAFFLQTIAGSAQNFGGNPARIKWNQVNTERVRVIFPKGIDSQANRIANLMLVLGDSTAATIGGKQKKWNVILQNQTTQSNAYVRQAPIMSELFMTPPQDNFSTGSIRWDDNLIIHENRHIQQLSNFNKGFTKVFSFLLGQEGQLLANGMTIPDYFFEGDAVWQETLVSKQGRGRMPSFYNPFKALLLADKNYSWMKLRNGSYKDLTPDHYALGYQLVAYGYEKYGDRFWEKVTQDAVRFKGLFYPFNRAIERHSGTTYKAFRDAALLYFKERSFPVNTSETATAITLIDSKAGQEVTDYQFPNYINPDSVLVSKQANNKLRSFYIIAQGKETKLRVRDITLDDYYTYRNGRILFTAYESDPRWANRDYSVIKVLDIYSGIQRQLTFRSKYFSPDINEDGSMVLAVSVNADGTNNLCLLDGWRGDLVKTLPNPARYFFTQTRYLDAEQAISAVRNPQGEMAICRIDLQTGTCTNLTPFTNRVLGYPSVHRDTIYFSGMYGYADQVFALTLKNNKLFRITDSDIGVYQPAVAGNGNMLVSVFTAGGYRLGQINVHQVAWQEISETDWKKVSSPYSTGELELQRGAAVLSQLDGEKADTGMQDITFNVSPYRKSFKLFNFHSWRPVAEDPEYGYSFFSDNVLSSFRNTVSYTYNRTDRSHTLGLSSAFAGWFPVLSLGAEQSFNRTLDTAVGKQVQFNTAKLSAGIAIPLRFVQGRTSKLFRVGGGYNIEQYYYRGVGKSLFGNRAIKYMNAFLSFSNVGQQARQHVNPRWAQVLSVNYRDAFNFSNSHKFVAQAAFYFPGISVNHSFVVNAAYQKRDSLPDLFSKNFSYARGYEALSTRRMYKLGVNYQLPLVYPDWGFANLLFFQRIRGNAFFDYTEAKARVNNLLTEIRNRSTGAEIYFDMKIWNAYPVSIGLRFSHLLDTDLLNPGVRNRWEILIPIGLIPD